MSGNSINSYTEELAEIAICLEHADWETQGKLINRILKIIVDDLPSVESVNVLEINRLKRLMVLIISNISSEPDKENFKSEFAILLEKIG